MRRRLLVLVLLCGAPSAFAAGQCTFWLGLAQADLQFSDNFQRTVYRARLRESSRMPLNGGLKVELAQAGSVIEGSHDGDAGGTVSTGRGSADVKGDFPAGYVFVDKSGRPVNYALELHAFGDAHFTVQIKWKDGKITTYQHPFHSIYLGKWPDPQQPRIIEGGEMHGDYTAQDGPSKSIHAWWNLKAVVAPCDHPPGIPEVPPEKKAKCSPPESERALLDTTWSQREAKAEQLKEDYKELSDANEAMKDHQAAWRAAIPICAIEEIAEKTAEAVLTGFGGEQAELTEILGKMATGDLSYLAQGDWSNLGDAISNITTILGGAVGVGDPKAMGEQIEDCKELPADLKDAAKAFVDAYAEVKSLMPRVKRDVNDVHSLDQKYWDQWQKYYQDCLAYAECMGRPATDCPKPPETPSGPMPE